MDIQDFKNRKKKLENDIAREISSLMIHFRRETKFSPQYISINLIDATTINEENKAFIVSRVTVDIEI